MPALHKPPAQIRANSNTAREYGFATGGGRVAQRMIDQVSWHSEHAGQVLLSAPVLFWLFQDYEYQHIAETIETLGSARRIIREHFELPKSMLRVRGPWPRGANRRLFQFFRMFEPAILSNEIPKPDDVWKFMKTIDQFVQSGVISNRAPREFDAVTLFALRNWKAIAETPDVRHTCDWLWIAAQVPLPKKLSADAMMRQIERWDIARRKERHAIENEPIPSLAGYPDAVIVEEGAFTLIRTPTGLREEGADMSHCVGSYVGAVRSGRSIIWHFEFGNKNPERTTLEIRPTTRDDHTMTFKIAQNRGPHNGQISPRAASAAIKLERYMNEYFGIRQQAFFTY